MVMRFRQECSQLELGTSRTVVGPASNDEHRGDEEVCLLTASNQVFCSLSASGLAKLVAGQAGRLWLLVSWSLVSWPLAGWSLVSWSLTGWSAAR